MNSTVYSTLSGAALERSVLTEYPLAEPLACRLFHRGLNDTYLVLANGNRFALRLYRANWRSPPAVAAELEAILCLDARGVPISMPHARRDGGLITTVQAAEGSRSAVMFHWAHGVEPQYNDAAHAALFGRSAACLHKATADVPMSSTRPAVDRVSLLEAPCALLAAELSEHPPLSRRLRELMERTRARLSQAEAALSWGFCHGDLHGGNARIFNDRLTLFDLDCCGHGWQLYDLATYRWAARLRRLEERSWPAFRLAYLQERPEAAAWMEWVPLFMILRHLWLMGLHIRNAEEMGRSFATEAFFDGLVTFCEEIEAQNGMS